MIESILVGALIVFLAGLFIETKRKSERVRTAIAAEKSSIAEDSGMTAILGVFTPDTQTAVVIGASEELGAFYYRMLRQAKVIIRSRMSLASLDRVEFLINGEPRALEGASEQLTTSLRATDIADRMIGAMSNDDIKKIRKAAMRVNFHDESGAIKALEITTMRVDDERHRFERVQLLKTTIWWVSFLQMSSRNARHTLASLTDDAMAEMAEP